MSTTRDSINKIRADMGLRLIEDLSMSDLIQLLLEMYARSGRLGHQKHLHDIWVELETELKDRIEKMETKYQEVKDHLDIWEKHYGSRIMLRTDGKRYFFEKISPTKEVSISPKEYPL